ncbi:MAG: arylamine N-acetyltransferase [Candidatus Zixiibacteriota bacterium]
MSDTGLFGTYLSVLGLSKEPPNRNYLTRLVRAHQYRVPFENISKLLYLKRDGVKGIPDFEKFIDGMKRHHFGGTCYSNNHYLCLLLRHLGFEACLNGADMQNPDVHIVIRVKLEGCEYFVDVGYAAPFLDPMPADSESDFEVEFGTDRYVLRPRDIEDRSRMDLYRKGELLHGYLVKPTPREISYFAPAIVDSYRESATFMNALLLTRFAHERSVVICNYTVTEYTGGKATVSRAKDKSELCSAIRRHFGISESIAHEALQEIKLSGDAWS